MLQVIGNVNGDVIACGKFFFKVNNIVSVDTFHIMVQFELFFYPLRFTVRSQKCIYRHHHCHNDDDETYIEVQRLKVTHLPLISCYFAPNKRVATGSHFHLHKFDK